MNKELLIQKYFKGTLNAEEQQRFDELMENDEAFVAEVEEYKSLQKVIKEQERTALKAQLILLEKQKTVEANRGNIRNLWPLAIAAALAILLAIAGILYWPQSDNAAQLYAAHFEPYPNALKPIKRGQETTSLEVQAFLAYEEGNYDLAVEKFETLLSEKDSSGIRFYYAMSLQNAEKIEQALNELKQIDGRADRFQPQIEWYLALIYIQKEEWEYARGRLNNLINLDIPFKQNEATTLLTNLEDK